MSHHDFYVTKVKQEKGVIVELEVRNCTLDSKKNEVVGEPMRVPRLFVANLIEKKLVDFCTAIEGEKGWVCGDKIELYNSKFLTTRGNSCSNDNLDSLPALAD